MSLDILHTVEELADAAQVPVKAVRGYDSTSVPEFFLLLLVLFLAWLAWSAYRNGRQRIRLHISAAVIAIAAWPLLFSDVILARQEFVELCQKGGLSGDKLPPGYSIVWVFGIAHGICDKLCFEVLTKGGASFVEIAPSDEVNAPEPKREFGGRIPLRRKAYVMGPVNRYFLAPLGSKACSETKSKEQILRIPPEANAIEGQCLAASTQQRATAKFSLETEIGALGFPYGSIRKIDRAIIDRSDGSEISVFSSYTYYAGRVQKWLESWVPMADPTFVVAHCHAPITPAVIKQLTVSGDSLD